jgi:hypothetical protein
MALDQSALLEVLEALKAAKVGDRVRQAAETTPPMDRSEEAPKSVVRPYVDDRRVQEVLSGSAWNIARRRAAHSPWAPPPGRAREHGSGGRRPLGRYPPSGCSGAHREPGHPERERSTAGYGDEPDQERP